MSTLTREETESLIQEVLEVYPEKAKKDRAKHLAINDQSVEQSKKCITSNRKSLPGVMTIRGCAYAGSRGVVWGPVKDMIHISHGPVGCGQYSRAGRRNYYVGTTGVNTFAEMNFTSDFQEKDIVFGGDKKLAKIMNEIESLFPLHKGITVQSECPIGLIGDDIEAVSKKAAKEINKVVVPVRCEGFRGVSQSLGHHIANDAVRDWVLSNRDGQHFESTPYDVTIIGDYNIGGDACASRIFLEEMGLRVIAQWSGDGTIAEMENTPKAKLNLLHCYRSMNYISRHMEEKYGIPWMEYNFFGPTKIEESLRRIAAFFDLPNSPEMGRDPNTPDWVQHIALEVDSVSELEVTKLRLEEAGIPVVGVTDHTIFKSIYFFDPNGHRLELAANTATPEMMRKLDEVKWDMLAEWDATKRAPKHAAWMHERQFVGH